MKRWWTPVPDAADEPADWPDLLVLASTILGEAEGEDYAGKRLVAQVVMNRTADLRWPSDPSGVCLQKLQFSCWNVGSPRLPRMFAPQKHVPERMWADCFRAACEAMFGIGPDFSGGANHYLAPKSLAKLPKWASADAITLRHGGHTFYRL